MHHTNTNTTAIRTANVALRLDALDVQRLVAAGYLRDTDRDPTAIRTAVLAALESHLAPLPAQNNPVPSRRHVQRV